jgi:hypothetical protein
MKTKIEYTKGEIGKVKIIKDSLPPQSDLVLRDANKTPIDPVVPAN